MTVCLARDQQPCCLSTADLLVTKKTTATSLNHQQFRLRHRTPIPTFLSSSAITKSVRAIVPTTSPKNTTNMVPSTTTGSLDYNKCTSTELRAFIRNRSSLKPSDSEELAHFHKSHLIARLDMLDKYLRFRFLDLPPELRLEVYKYILISRNCEAPEAGGQVIETSLLRTCRLVYKEAAPVLYGENEFTVSISPASEPWSSSSTSSLSREPCWEGRHCVGIFRSGRPAINDYIRNFPNVYGPFMTHMASCSCFDVLRRIRRLTLFFGRFCRGTSSDFAAICSILSGASRLTKVTVVLGEQCRETFNIKDLAATFWGVALLRGEVQLEFKSEVKAVEAQLAKGYDTLFDMLEQHWDSLRKKPYRGQEAPGDLISKGRDQKARLTKEDRERWYMRHAGTMLDNSLPWLVMPTAVDASYVRIRIEWWITLQSCVNQNTRFDY